MHNKQQKQIMKVVGIVTILTILLGFVIPFLALGQK